MSLGKILLGGVVAVGVLAAGVALYLAYGDLSRHKPRLETLISEQTGRAFEIGGPFKLRVLPELVIEAEQVRLISSRLAGSRR